MIRKFHTQLACTMLAAAACSSSSAPTAPSPQDSTRTRIVALGDSLAVSPSISQSFPTHLQQMISAERPGWTVVNAGASGDTTAGGVRRAPELLESDVAVLVLALGANDGLRGVPVTEVEQNLSTIITLAQSRGIRVLLCGMETPPTHGWDYSLAFHNIFPRVARNHDVPLVPFLLAGVALNPEMNGPDGWHPNAAGARRIAETVWTYLQPLVRAAASATASAA